MSPVICFIGCRYAGLPNVNLDTYYKSALHFLSNSYKQVEGYLSLAASIVVLTVVVLPSLVVASEANKPLTLDQAVSFAIEHDAWLSGSSYTQKATEALAESAYQLPDPKLSLKIVNLPTDTLDFNQEAMTQLVAGVSQMYPRGDSRRLKRQQLQQQSAQQPLLRSERQAKLTLTITQLWLDAYQARQSIKLIEKDRALFDQLVDISLAGYSSALGRTRQQDLIKAQLEQTRIEDRLTRLLQKQEVVEQRLLEWLLPSGNGSRTPGANLLSGYSAEQPVIQSLYAERWKDKPPSNSELVSSFIRHPSVQKIDQSIAVAVTAVRLAKQKYKPEWGMNASYGFRGEDASGRDRSDLFSVGVTVSMPLFSSIKQDREVDAATASQEKIRTDRSLMISRMIASFHSARTQLERLDQRRKLFDRKLIPQIKQQAKASLNAYESDNGSFIEVLRPRIDQLNAQIEYLEIKVAKQKQIAQLNYFLTSIDSTSANASLSVSGAD
ncbi:TolC family protein [Neptunomonas sp.]|uniref:TolC family protein n=1 Tax=Neptunomonas sp. TaxID=1971898 RepID=UPI0025DB84E5|nr:TolC family protein [Neptunomonas sp.]